MVLSHSLLEVESTVKRNCQGGINKRKLNLSYSKRGAMAAVILFLAQSLQRCMRMNC